MKHFFTRRVRIVLLCAVLLAVLLATVSSLTGSNFPGKVVQGILSPIRAGVSRLTDKAEQLYDYMFRYEALKAEMIRDGELIASYPAQDASLGEVAAIALTSSSWYQRYTTLQNYWFTAHKVHEFSNEQVLRAAYQNDDTILAHVVFDYFADNGEVHRTWNIGYQMTFLNTAEGWKVAGMEINNELNPNSVIPQ